MLAQNIPIEFNVAHTCPDFSQDMERWMAKFPTVKMKKFINIVPLFCPGEIVNTEFLGYYDNVTFKYKIHLDKAQFIHVPNDTTSLCVIIPIMHKFDDPFHIFVRNSKFYGNRESQIIVGIIDNIPPQNSQEICDYFQYHCCSITYISPPKNVLNCDEYLQPIVGPISPYINIPNKYYNIYPSQDFIICIRSLFEYNIFNHTMKNESCQIHDLVIPFYDSSQRINIEYINNNDNLGKTIEERITINRIYIRYNTFNSSHGDSREEINPISTPSDSDNDHEEISENSKGETENDNSHNELHDMRKIGSLTICAEISLGPKFHRLISHLLENTYYGSKSPQYVEKTYSIDLYTFQYCNWSRKIMARKCDVIHRFLRYNKYLFTYAFPPTPIM